MTSSEHILLLFSAMYDCLAKLNDERVDAFLAFWPEEAAIQRFIEPSHLPVLHWLETAVSVTVSQTRPLAKQLVQAAPHLAWGQTYTTKDFGAHFLTRYGWTELMGLRGPIANTEMACGFLLLGPDIEYPPHSHEAEEIYLPLTANSLWLRNQADWQPYPAGVSIYHPPWMPHAMRTKEAPLLALYLWHGRNLVQKSHIEKDHSSV